MGLLSNLLNDDSGKKAAGSVSDMEKALASDRWITIHPHGFLQGEGEDETKQYYRRIYIDDDGNIEKGLGAGHNIKNLSKVMKEKKKGGGEEKSKEEIKTKAPEKKEDKSKSLAALRDKVKQIIDDGNPYNEEKSQKVGEVIIQILENDEDFQAAVGVSERMAKVQEEMRNFDPQKDKIFQKARQDFMDYKDKIDEKFISGEIKSYDSLKDPKYQELNAKYRQARDTAYQRNEDSLLKKYGLGHNVSDNELSEKVIGIVHKSLDGVIDFDKTANPKDFTRSKDLQPPVQNALSVFSKDMVNDLKDNGVSLKKRSARRSCYQNSTKEVLIGTKDREGDNIGVITHEFSHAVEHANPEIVKIEEDFYNRRTKGEQLQKLSVVTGNSNYKFYEVTRVDKFLHPYMGKDYSTIRGGVVTKKADAYELLSMGTQYLVTKPHELMKDRDYMRFVVGCLAYRRK